MSKPIIVENAKNISFEEMATLFDTGMQKFQLSEDVVLVINPQIEIHVGKHHLTNLRKDYDGTQITKELVLQKTIQTLVYLASPNPRDEQEKAEFRKLLERVSGKTQTELDQIVEASMTLREYE